MKKSIMAFTVLVFVHFFSFTSYSQSPEINAKSYILIDSKTGQVLCEQNSDQQLHPASTTKIMTAILAIENGDMDQIMTANPSAVLQKYIDKEGINLGIGINGSNAGIVEGEQLRLEDLLNVLLIKSANDAANIIAENISPSRSEFIELMNNKAIELGATNTNFTNACGLDVQDGHPNHYTTASDLSKIARYAMSLPKFAEIVTKTKYTMPETNKHPASYWPADYITTTNKLLLYNKYKSPLYQVTGMKTGYTVSSGFNLVGSGKNVQGMELIAVVLGSTAADSHYLYSKELLDYGFNNFSIQKISDSGVILKAVDVEDAEAETKLELITENEFQNVMPVDKENWKIEKKEFIVENVKAPVNKGDVLGYIEYVQNNVSIGKVNLVAATSINRKASPLETLKESTLSSDNLIFKVLTETVVFIIAFLLLRHTLKKVSRQIRKKKQ